MAQVIVVGGGIAGSAAALRAAQYNLSTLWIRGDRRTAKASRGEYVRNIDNMIGFDEGVFKEVMLEELAEAHPACAEALRAGHFHAGTRAIIRNTVDRLRQSYSQQVEILEEAATAARREGERFVLETPSGTHTAPYLVLATGVTDRQPRIRRTVPSGRTLDDIHWVFPYANHETFLYCVRCEGHLTAGTPTAVIGHSAAAGEVALMLHERYGTPVSILTNGEAPAFPRDTERLHREYGIAVRTERLVDLRGRPREGELCTIELEGGGTVDVRMALVALGLHRVHNDLAVQVGCRVEPDAPATEAHVIVDERSETTVRGCFAVGDMATLERGAIRKQIYTAQEYAVRALDAIDRRVRASRRRSILGDPGAA